MIAKNRCIFQELAGVERCHGIEITAKLYDKLIGFRVIERNATNGINRFR